MVITREKEYRREAAQVNVGEASRLTLFKRRKISLLAFKA
jgi:hypothetical protein